MTGAEPSRAARLWHRVVPFVERVAGTGPARTVTAVLTAYDIAGGGIAANGLAYSALFALVPGLLLVLSAVGVVVDDPEVRAQIVSLIRTAFPPLESIAGDAFDQVSSGAVPTGIVAVVGLLWGSSRFYAALDVALTRIFRVDRARNELVRGARGIALSMGLVALPIALVSVASAVGALLELLPATLQPQGWLRAVFAPVSPAGLFVVFVVGVALVYRFVPPLRVPVRAIRAPALFAGLSIALFTQLFAFIAPRLVGYASLFGALVAVFAVLVWLSISLTVLLLGACWVRVRMGPAGPATQA